MIGLAAVTQEGVRLLTIFGLVVLYVLNMARVPVLFSWIGCDAQRRAVGGQRLLTTPTTG